MTLSGCEDDGDDDDDYDYDYNDGHDDEDDYCYDVDDAVTRSMTLSGYRDDDDNEVSVMIKMRVIIPVMIITRTLVLLIEQGHRVSNNLQTNCQSFHLNWIHTFIYAIYCI